PDARVERLAGVPEREHAVLVPDLLRDRILQRRTRRVEPGLREAVGGRQGGADPRTQLVVRLAALRLRLRAAEGLAYEEIVVGVLLGEPAPAGPCRQGRQEFALGGADAEGGGRPARAQRPERGV